MDMRRLVGIFCQIDDFCKELDEYSRHYLLTGPSKGKRGPPGGLAVSEIMTILVMFQMSRFRDFKNFYTGFCLFITRAISPNFQAMSGLYQL